MKTKHLMVTAMLGIALAGVVFTGCKKKSTADTDTTAAQDEANATFAMNDAKNISDGAAKGQANEKMVGASCGQITKRDTTVGGTTDTLIDIFFPGTCTSPDGRIRKGHILLLWNGKGYFDSAAMITQTFQNYSVAGIGVAGTRTLTNTGKNAFGQQNWKFTANLTITYSSGKTATWQSTRTNTLVSISGNYYYQITGSATGTSQSGATYNLNISSPLYVTALPWWLGGCAWIESGTIDITRSTSSNTLSLDFGAVGTCDNKATATINGNVYNITLP